MPGTSTSSSEAFADGDEDLYCPQCEYPLVALEEQGVSRCPECGSRLNFDMLREWRRYGRDLGPEWRMVRKLIFQPKRFLDELAAPRYYLRLESEHRHLRNAIGAGLCWPAIVAFMINGFMVPVFPTLWVLTLLAAHFGARWWMRMLLGRVGHGAPREASHRIVFFASPVLLAIQLAVLLVFALVGFITDFLQRMARIDLRLGDSHLDSLAAAVGVIVLAGWLYWSYVLMLGFKLETRSFEPMSAPLAFFNLGLALGIGLPAAVMIALILG